MQNTTAPYRADEVGSLLRTAPLKDARAKREKGQITPDQLKKVEDEEIKKIIRKQEEVGLQLATDGEFRRPGGISILLEARGCERVVLDHGIQFHGIQTKPESLEGHQQVRFPRRSSHARALQVPESQHQGHAEDDHPLAVGHAFPRRAPGHQHKTAYPEWAPTSTTSLLTARPSRQFYDAGCRTSQLDDTVWASICARRSSWIEAAPAARTPDSSPASTPRRSTRR